MLGVHEGGELSAKKLMTTWPRAPEPQRSTLAAMRRVLVWTAARCGAGHCVRRPVLKLDGKGVAGFAFYAKNTAGTFR